MLDMSHTRFPPHEADGTLPASINVQFMQENDDIVLSYGGEETLWWKSDDQVYGYRFTSEIMTKYFNNFYDTVMAGPIRRDPNISTYFVSGKVDIPGLAERPPNPIPGLAECPPTALPRLAERPPNAIPSSANAPHNAVIQVERRVDEALRVGVEAADKSVARIAAYDILGSLSGESTSGIPFSEGEPLPQWFPNAHPAHEYDDPTVPDNETPGTIPASPSSGTSIPEDFDPEHSDNGSDGEDSEGSEYEGSDSSEGDYSGPLGDVVDSE